MKYRLLKDVGRERWWLVALLGFFVFRGVEFIFNILPYITPDEMYHVDLSVLYSKGWGWVRVEDLGEVGFITAPDRMPYLYHWLMGKLLWLNFSGLPAYQYLRLWNLVISVIEIGRAHV